MIWHILTIVFGVLTIAAAACPHWSSNVVLGVLVVIFAGLAMKNFKRGKK